jgi:hypothetical protein
MGGDVVGGDEQRVVRANVESPPERIPENSVAFRIAKLGLGRTGRYGWTGRTGRTVVSKNPVYTSL